MSQICRTCKHHCPITGSARTDLVGECRAVPPVVNYAFPRTRAEDWCGSWQSKPFDGQVTPGAALHADAVGLATESARSAGNRPRRATPVPMGATTAPAVPGVS